MQETGQITLRWTLIALTVAAVAELLIWRTFSRVGVFIPKGEKSVMMTVYEVSVQIGTILLNFAVILAVLSLLLSMWWFRVEGELATVRQAGVTAVKARRNLFLTIAMVALVVVLLCSFVTLAVVQNLAVSTTLRLAMMVAFSALAADIWLRDQSWQMRLFAVLLLVGYWFQLLAKLLSDTVFPLLGVNWQEAVFQPLMQLGELAVILNGYVAFLAFTRKTSQQNGPARDMLRHPKSLAGSVVIVGIFTGLTFLTIAESFIVPILGLYALGYQMQWPLPLYIISLFFFLYTVFYCLGEWKRGVFYRAAGLGLILLFTGGYTFQISDQYLFALVGVLLLARPELLGNTLRQAASSSGN